MLDTGQKVGGFYRYGFLIIDVEKVSVFSKKIGDDLDGDLDYEELKYVTRQVLTWPAVERYEAALI